MKFWKNHEERIKKAAILAGAIAVMAAAVFGIFFLMNKDAVIRFISQKTGRETTVSVFEDSKNAMKETKINGKTEAVSETFGSEGNAVLEGKASGENVPEKNLSENMLSEKNVSEETVSGEAKSQLSKNEKEKTLADDLRIHGFPYIELTSQLETGDYVDVRIAFADGTDTILLSKKQIQGLAPLREGGSSSIWMIVSEEEIQRLSKAEAEVCLNQGSRIYAIEYLSEEQKAADVNYAAGDWKKKSVEEDTKEVYPKQEEIIYLD